MPSNSSNAPPPPATRHAKRVEVVLDDGWSVITHKAPRNPEPRSTSKSSKTPKSKSDLISNIESTNSSADSTDPTSITTTSPKPSTRISNGPSRRERRKKNNIDMAFEKLRKDEITPKEYNDQYESIRTKTGLNAMPAQMVEGLTVEKMAEEFERLTKSWRDCECRRGLMVALEGKGWGGTGKVGIAGASAWGVTEGVCFGTGSFSVDWEHRIRAMWQLVLFIDVVERVRINSDSIPLYAQEPAYTALDTSFLAHLGITVCEINAKSYVTRNSFLYTPFIDWRILNLIILPGTDPTLFIGNEVTDDMTTMTHNAGTQNPEYILQGNKVAKKWLKNREGCMLKGAEDVEGSKRALQGLWICWRVHAEEKVQGEIDDKGMPKEKAAEAEKAAEETLERLRS